MPTLSTLTISQAEGDVEWQFRSWSEKADGMKRPIRLWRNVTQPTMGKLSFNLAYPESVYISEAEIKNSSDSESSCHSFPLVCATLSDHKLLPQLAVLNWQRVRER